MSAATFRFERNGRIEIKYENGLVASIIFNKYKYSRINKDGDFISFELAVFDEKGEWVTKKIFQKIYDNVIGYIPIDELDIYLKKIKNYKMVKE